MSVQLASKTILKIYGNWIILIVEIFVEKIHSHLSPVISVFNLGHVMTHNNLSNHYSEFTCETKWIEYCHMLLSLCVFQEWTVRRAAYFVALVRLDDVLTLTQMRPLLC